MKKVIKSFTFWFILLAIFLIYMHQIGQDSKSIVLIQFNPILSEIAVTQGSLYHFMQSGTPIACNTILGQISIYWYIGCILTNVYYGIVLDILKYLIKKRT